MADDTAFEDDTTFDPKWDSKFRRTMLRQEGKTERMKARWQSHSIDGVIIGGTVFACLAAVVALFIVMAVDSPSNAEIVDGCLKRIDSDDRLSTEEYNARAQACELIPVNN